METYPHHKLPAFGATDYGYEDHDNLDRTEIAGAAEDVALRTQHSGTVCTVSSRMTYCQLRIFEAFWQYKINRGLDWFQLDLAVGQGLTEHTARWIGTYKAVRDGWFHWRVSGRIEVEAKAVLGHDETLYTLYDEDLAGMLHELVHVTLPGIWG